MRKLAVFLFSTLLVVGCSSSSDDFTGGGPEPTACSNDGQKQFVLDALYDWYLWNDLLPANIDIADYASPESLVLEVTTTFGPQDALGNPIDRWSSVGSLAADQQYYGEGRYEGFGFSWREEGGDMRMTGVFPGSPADNAGLARGQTVITLNNRTYADIVANEGINTFFDNNATVEFAMRRLDNTTFSEPVTKDIVTITPIPQWRTINIGDGVPPVGYMEFRTFVSTADPVFDQVFADFIAAGVQDVIIDLRYNGGGLVRTAELLGDYLGGFANDGLVFSQTEFNAERAAANNSASFFSRRANSLDITRFIVVASRSTASASELVTNSLIPYADVWIVGDNTFGKPVGQCLGLLAGLGTVHAGDGIEGSAKADKLDACVAPTPFIRRNHFELIKHQRDITVHKGIRKTDHSLAGCVAEHVQAGVAAHEHFHDVKSLFSAVWLADQ